MFQNFDGERGRVQVYKITCVGREVGGGGREGRKGGKEGGEKREEQRKRGGGGGRKGEEGWEGVAERGEGIIGPLW